MEEKLRKIRSMTENTINELGYDLYFLEFVREEGQEYLRFYIENQTGEAIVLEDCEKVSHAVSPIIDQADPIESQYFLEVSSPGLFRQLFTKEHVEGAVGERVLVKLKTAVDGRKKLIGILESFDGDTVVIGLDNGNETIDYSDIRSMNLEPVV